MVQGHGNLSQRCSASTLPATVLYAGRAAARLGATCHRRAAPHGRGRPADIYALGACLFTFVFGRIPFNAASVAKLFQVVQTEPLRFPTDIAVAPHLTELLAAMLDKDPDTRISLRHIMAHPWVTLEGRWPCKSIRDIKSCIREEAEGDVLDTLVADDPMPHLDFLATANVVDLPPEDWLAPLVTPDLERRELADGEYLMRQGETGTSMMFIEEGEVDVITKLRSLGGRPGQTGSKPPSAVGEDAASAAPEAVAGAETPVEELPPTIVEAALRAQELTSKLRVGKREFKVATRAAQSFVGEMELFAAPPVRCASVRARGRVVVAIVPLDTLVAYLKRRPEAKHELQLMLWGRQSENLVLEALAHLSAISDVLEELLTTTGNVDINNYIDDV